MNTVQIHAGHFAAFRNRVVLANETDIAEAMRALAKLEQAAVGGASSPGNIRATAQVVRTTINALRKLRDEAFKLAHSQHSAASKPPEEES